MQNMTILKADGTEMTRDIRGVKVRLADVYKTPGQKVLDLMNELKQLTEADLADFRAWFEAAGYPCGPGAA